ncbi:heavy-metal-associated domain-containing protein [bacterium]|nr:heavy-metal-associated domain-containing protein [bacterium]
MNKLILKIEGMGCDMCVSKVTAALSAVDLVAEVKVSLESGSAEIFYYGENAPNKAVLRSAVEKAGFKAV